MTMYNCHKVQVAKVQLELLLNIKASCNQCTSGVCASVDGRKPPQVQGAKPTTTTRSARTSTVTYASICNGL